MFNQMVIQMITIQMLIRQSQANFQLQPNVSDIQQLMENFCTYFFGSHRVHSSHIINHSSIVLSNAFISVEFIIFIYFCRINKGNDVEEVIEIPEVMFNGGRLRQRHFYDEILLALTRQPIQQVDSAVTQGVSLSF